MKDTIVSKAQFSRALDCPRSRITQLAQSGMPTRSDGRLNRNETLRWLVRNVSGAGGGWWGDLRGKASIVDRAQALLDGKPLPKPGRATRGRAHRAAAEGGALQAEGVDAQWALLDRIRETAALRLPDLARGLGLPEYVAVAAADIFDSLLFLVDADVGLADYQWPIPPTPPPSASAEVEQDADDFCTRLTEASDKIFAPAVLADQEKYYEFVEWARKVS